MELAHAYIGKTTQLLDDVVATIAVYEMVMLVKNMSVTFNVIIPRKMSSSRSKNAYSFKHLVVMTYV